MRVEFCHGKQSTNDEAGLEHLSEIVATLEKMPEVVDYLLLMSAYVDGDVDLKMMESEFMAHRHDHGENALIDTVHGLGLVWYDVHRSQQVITELGAVVIRLLQTGRRCAHRYAARG